MNGLSLKFEGILHVEVPYGSYEMRIASAKMVLNFFVKRKSVTAKTL